jgi:dihydroorotate dehydrogenase electron transfer subunit
MKKVDAKIVSVETIAKETVKMVLENDYISKHAKPGQFVHIRVTEHTLRRPISIAETDKDNHTFTILFKTIGSGTKRLANYRVGEFLDLLGPNGSSFPLDLIKENETLLLIGGGIGVPPIHFLATELKKLNVNVHAILGFQSEEYLFYEDEFKALNNVTIVTDDGSYGKKGFVTDYVHDVGSVDRYFACGPLPMLKAVAKELKDVEGYLSFEERMGCGIGACYACVIPTTTEDKYKKICQDGPVFAANEVKL